MKLLGNLLKVASLTVELDSFFDYNSCLVGNYLINNYQRGIKCVI